MNSYQMGRNVCPAATATPPNRNGAFPRRVTITTGVPPIDNYSHMDNEGEFESTRIDAESNAFETYDKPDSKQQSNRTMASSETCTREGDPLLKQRGNSYYREGSQNSCPRRPAGSGSRDGRFVKDLLHTQNEIAVFLASTVLRMANVIEKNKGYGDLEQAKRVCESVKFMVKKHRQHSDKLASLTKVGVYPAEEQRTTTMHPSTGSHRDAQSMPAQKRMSFENCDDYDIEHPSKRYRRSCNTVEPYGPKVNHPAFRPPERIEIRGTAVDVCTLAEDRSRHSPEIPENRSVKPYY